MCNPGVRTSPSSESSSFRSFFSAFGFAAIVERIQKLFRKSFFFAVTSPAGGCLFLLIDTCKKEARTLCCYLFNNIQSKDRTKNELGSASYFPPMRPVCSSRGSDHHSMSQTNDSRVISPSKTSDISPIVSLQNPSHTFNFSSVKIPATYSSPFSKKHAYLPKEDSEIGAKKRPKKTSQRPHMHVTEHRGGKVLINEHDREERQVGRSEWSHWIQGTSTECVS